MKLKNRNSKLTATDIEMITREIVKTQNAAARMKLDLDEYYNEQKHQHRRGRKPFRTFLGRVNTNKCILYGWKSQLRNMNESNLFCHASVAMYR